MNVYSKEENIMAVHAKENTLEIKSKLRLSNFLDSDVLDINLKQGLYSIIVEQEELVLMSKKEAVDIDSAEWKYVGDEEYASYGSDFHFIKIKDKNSGSPDLDMDWVEDNVENYYEFLDTVIFEIPSGNGGALSVYTTENEKGHIIAVRINGIAPEDM